MKDYVIIADATCDLNDELKKQYNVELVCGYMTNPAKQEIRAENNWNNQSMEEFYTALKKDPMGYSTAPAGVGEFAEVFSKFAEEGKDIICITISTGLSGTFDFVTQAANITLEKYPDTKIKCIDSKRFGPGFGLLVVNASIRRELGDDIETCAKWLEDNKNRFHQAGWLDDLSFVAKKGRMTNAKAFFGTLAGIKPIGEFDYNGLTTVIGKVKGAKKAYEVLVNYISDTIENPEEQTIFIAQSNRYDAAVKYKEMIEAKLNPKAVIIKDVYPNCGINIGPGLMAAYYIGKPISEGLKEETAIIEKYNA